MLVHFSSRPLHWFGKVSIWVFVMIAGILVVPVAFTAMDLSSTIVFPGITVLGLYLGVTLLSLGFLCELLNRVGDPGMERLYVVRETEGGAAGSQEEGGAP
jgi:hypothetical protein